MRPNSGGIVFGTGRAARLSDSLHPREQFAAGFAVEDPLPDIA